MAFQLKTFPLISSIGISSIEKLFQDEIPVGKQEYLKKYTTYSLHNFCSLLYISSPCI